MAKVGLAVKKKAKTEIAVHSIGPGVRGVHGVVAGGARGTPSSIADQSFPRGSDGRHRSDPELESWWFEKQQYEVFYPICEEGDRWLKPMCGTPDTGTPGVINSGELVYNHPEHGDDRDNWPNWMYYWSQIAGVYSPHKPDWMNVVYWVNPIYSGAFFHQSNPFGFAVGTVAISRTPVDDDSVCVEGIPCGGGTAGIDCFGQVMIHERFHEDSFWYPGGFSGRDPRGVPIWSLAEDPDEDRLSTTEELDLGWPQEATYTSLPEFDGRYFLDGAQAALLNRNPEVDGEVLAAGVERMWTNGSRDHLDWSCPGRNSE